MSGAIGFIQGRLSPPVDGKIQAFPWDHWQEEIRLAGKHGFPVIEWTLDHARLRENPLLTTTGQAELGALVEATGVCVVSITGDCFMQAPFFKAVGGEREALLNDLEAVIIAAARMGVAFLVFPLVDNGSVENERQADVLRAGMERIRPLLSQSGVRIAFESDFAPARLAAFIGEYPPEFGINYDSGNSAALGYDPGEELDAYGGRVLNVHVKDRLLAGTTVPLGMGVANLPNAIATLRDVGYAGDWILQTARADDGDHLSVLLTYREMVRAWISD